MSTNDLEHSPSDFYKVNLLLLLVGVLCWVLDASYFQSLQPITEKIKPASWGRFLTIYILSIPISGLCVYRIMKFLVKHLNLDRRTRSRPKFTPDDHRANFWSPIIVGYAELIMYPLAIVSGQTQLIGAWLVLKVAGQWAGWKGTGVGIELSMSRWRYNRFLVGTALNIIAAASTYAIMTIAGVLK